MRRVVRVIDPPEQPEGNGARVRRIVGTRQLKNLDPFLMLDHFYVQKPAGFPDHPHRGFETVTYMLSGTCLHEDFKGHKGAINPGDTQWMTAGRGIVHAEMPGTDTIEGMQLWLNLKREDKMCDPKYQDLLGDRIPKAEDNGAHVAIIAGSAMGQTAETITKTPALYIDVTLDPGASFVQDVQSGWNGFFYVIQGSVSVAGTKIPLHQAGVLSSEEPQVQFTTEEGARFFLFCGQPLNEPIVQHGPFVMSTQEEIAQTFEDYRNQRNGFEGALGWRSEIGNR